MKLYVPILLASALIVNVLSEKLDESSNVIEGKVEKKDKRGLFGLGYAYGATNYGVSNYGASNYGASNYGTLGGYGLGSSIASSYPQYHPLAYEAPLPHFPASIHTTITKHVPIAVPQPVPVPVEKHIPVPAPYPVEVPVIKTVPVAVDRPYAVPVDRPYAVPVDRPYPVAVPQPVPVPVYKHVGVPIPHPVPVAVSKPLVLPYFSKEVYAHHAHGW